MFCECSFYPPVISVPFGKTVPIPTIDRSGCSGFHMNWKNKDYRNKQSLLIEDFVHRIVAFLVLVFHMAHTWGVDRGLAFSDQNMFLSFIVCDPKSPTLIVL